MRVGVLGSGGREHALVWALEKSRREVEVVAMPGNGGTPRNVPVDARDPEAVARAVDERRLDLLIVGGEEPLERGVVDRLQTTRTVPFGPTARAARLETSKRWAKEFLDRHTIPTAGWMDARSENDVRKASGRWGRTVVKADGLAAGKGVIVCDDEMAAVSAWRTLRATRPRDSILVEEALAGWEVSILCLTDGRSAARFAPTCDHKAAFDGGRGPNTGGMGAYAPAPQCAPDVEDDIVRQIVEPTLAGLRDEGIAYCGFLYFGLMMTEDGPRVLEYNARLGDPEAEVVLPLLDADLVDAVEACVEGRLGAGRLPTRPGAAVDVVLAAGGYPGTYGTGDSIEGLDRVDDEALVFHGATERVGSGWRTAGGRVLHVVGRGPTVSHASAVAYRNAERVSFAGCRMRRDIGRGVA